MAAIQGIHSLLTDWITLWISLLIWLKDESIEKQNLLYPKKTSSQQKSRDS
jgi:hypothetical protein